MVATPRARANVPARRCRHCRAGSRRHARRRPPPRRHRSPSRRPRSRAACLRRRPKARRVPAGNADRALPRRRSAPARSSARVKPARAGSDLVYPLHRRASPATRAMRSSNCGSSRKFWPSALEAASPCRAITSRSGGRSARRVTPGSRSGSRTARAALGAFSRPCGSRRWWRPAPRDPCRRSRRRCRDRARRERSAAPASC